MRSVSTSTGGSDPASKTSRAHTDAFTPSIAAPTSVPINASNAGWSAL